MINSLGRMITCHWSARHLQRYLDADPAAPLKAEEVARLESHLAICEKCTQAASEHRALHRALSMWPGRPIPDADAVQRLRGLVDHLADPDVVQDVDPRPDDRS